MKKIIVLIRKELFESIVSKSRWRMEELLQQEEGPVDMQVSGLE